MQVSKTDTPLVSVHLGLNGTEPLPVEMEVDIRVVGEQ
jgi:hypothetical protein